MVESVHLGFKDIVFNNYKISTITNLSEFMFYQRICR